jgi:hypothetical protein
VEITFTRLGNGTFRVESTTLPPRVYPSAMPATYQRQRGGGPELAVFVPEPADNSVAELVDLARMGDRTGFDALAGCLMPAGRIAACWAGTRRRLGLEP